MTSLPGWPGWVEPGATGGTVPEGLESGLCAAHSPLVLSEKGLQVSLDTAGESVQVVPSFER